jgi:hypothetical protein
MSAPARDTARNPSSTGLCRSILPGAKKEVRLVPWVMISTRKSRQILSRSRERRDTHKVNPHPDDPFI